MARKSKQEITAIIACVMLAFIMWIYAMTAKNPLDNQTVDNIPVQLVNTGILEQFDLALVPEQNFTVSLDIKGKVLDLASAKKPERYSVVADFSNAPVLRKGENTIPIDITAFPSGIQIENPTKLQYSIKVKLEALEEKSIPVKINLVGSVKEGYGYLEPISKPNEMLVRGPESVVNTVKIIEGQIDITDKSDNYSRSIGIRPLDKDGKEVKYVNLSNKVVDVSVPIKPAKEVDLVVKTTGEIPGNKVLKKINQSQEKVMILGDKTYLDKIREIETLPFDISTIRSTHKDTLSMKLPEGIDIFSGTNTVNVEFVVENIIENTISIPINIVNPRGGFSYSTSVPDVSITLRGAESIMSTLNTGSISAIIDVNGLDEGQHNMGFEINIPNGLAVTKRAPDKVTVTISKPVSETTNP